MCKWRVDENAEHPEEVKLWGEEEVYIPPIYKFARHYNNRSTEILPLFLLKRKYAI